MGDTVTTAPGTDAQVQATCTPCGLRLDFAIPEGRPGASGSDVYASFFTFQQRFVNGQPIDYEAWPLIANPWAEQSVGGRFLTLVYSDEARVYDFREWIIR